MGDQNLLRCKALHLIRDTLMLVDTARVSDLMESVACLGLRLRIAVFRIRIAFNPFVSIS